MGGSTAITPATITVNASSISSINESTSIPGTLSVGTQSYPLSIKGHGNWTWYQPKQPFKIELNTKASLLTMPANKDWILLANWSDRGFTNTVAAMALGSSGSTQYWGIYQLIESVKISGVRIDEEPVQGDTGLGLTGTYLMEINQQSHPEDQPSTITTNRGLRIIMDDPDESASVAQRNYILNWINTFEEALFAPDAFTRTGNTSYRSMIDMTSFATWYVVEELASNQDSYFNGSCKIYKTQDTQRKRGVLFMGPLWDFDIGFGNTVNFSHDARRLCTLDTDPALGASATWLIRMFQDNVFMQAVNSAWNTITKLWGMDGAGLVALNASTTQDLSGGPQPNAFQRNMTRWEGQGYTYAAENGWSCEDPDYNLYPIKQAWINARFHFMERLYGNITLNSVTSTRYGAFTNQTVLNEMQAALMSRREVWHVTETTMKCALDWRDQYTIIYTQDGTVKQRTTGAVGGRFDFSKTILSVSYGAGNQYYNMTNKYNNDSAVFGNLYGAWDYSEEFIVNNTTMGGDPNPGVVKSCTIWYQQFPNQVKSINIPENAKVVFT